MSPTLENLPPESAGGRRYRFRSKVLLLLGTAMLCALAAEGIVRVAYSSGRLEYVPDDETLWCYLPNQTGYEWLKRPKRRSPTATLVERGFRSNGNEYSGDGRVRVLALGDSYTFGWGVEDQETFCSQLEQLSNGKLEVINAGMPGWGVFQEEIRLRRVIDTIRPDYVLVTIIQDGNLRQPFETEEQRRAFLASGRRRQFIRKCSRLVTLLARTLESWSLTKEGRAVPNAQPREDASDAGPSEAYRSCWEKDMLRLLAMKELAEQHGAKFAVAGWPSQSSGNMPFFRAGVADLSEKHGMVTVDLFEVLGGYRLNSDMRIPGDSHPTSRAHRIAAEEMFRVLFENEVSPPA